MSSNCSMNPSLDVVNSVLGCKCRYIISRQDMGVALGIIFLKSKKKRPVVQKNDRTGKNW